MIIPRFWAEGRIQKKLPNGKQATVRRFGWSDVSVAEAQTMADQRTSGAMQCLERGEKT